MNKKPNLSIKPLNLIKSSMVCFELIIEASLAKKEEIRPEEVLSDYKQ